MTALQLTFFSSRKIFSGFIHPLYIVYLYLAIDYCFAGKLLSHCSFTGLTTFIIVGDATVFCCCFHLITDRLIMQWFPKMSFQIQWCEQVEQGKYDQSGVPVSIRLA